MYTEIERLFDTLFLIHNRKYNPSLFYKTNITLDKNYNVIEKSLEHIINGNKDYNDLDNKLHK